MASKTASYYTVKSWSKESVPDSASSALQNTTPNTPSKSFGRERWAVHSQVLAEDAGVMEGMKQFCKPFMLPFYSMAWYSSHLLFRSCY